MDKKKRLPTIRQLSAGAILLARKDGRWNLLLMVQNNERYRESGRRMYDRVVDIGPSGMVGDHGDEKVFRAAKREVEEETGLSPWLEMSPTYDLKYEFNATARAGEHKGRMVHIIKTRRYYLAFTTYDELKRARLSDEHSEMMVVEIGSALTKRFLKPSQVKLLRRIKQDLESGKIRAK